MAAIILNKSYVCTITRNYVVGVVGRNWEELVALWGSERRLLELTRFGVGTNLKMLVNKFVKYCTSFFNPNIFYH